MTAVHPHSHVFSFYGAGVGISKFSMENSPSSRFTSSIPSAIEPFIFLAALLTALSSTSPVVLLAAESDLVLGGVVEGTSASRGFRSLLDVDCDDGRRSVRERVVTDERVLARGVISGASSKTSYDRVNRHGHLCYMSGKGLATRVLTNHFFCAGVSLIVHSWRRRCRLIHCFCC